MLPIHKVLAPTDFSDISILTLQNAGELAEHFGAELLIVYVIPTASTLPSDPHYTFEIPSYEDALRETSERRLQETAEQLGRRGLKVGTRVSYGDPALEIVRLAQEEEVNLIVIATHGLTGWQHIVFGSVAEKVVRTAKCPVLTVRGDPHPGEQKTGEAL